MSTPFAFSVLSRDGAARRGQIATSRGIIDTPAFMPVGTAGTVKALYTDQVRETGAQIVLGNTYHLMLRPGAEQVRDLGGLHRFMNWDGPILTDSGGYQVMSLSKLCKLDETGVTFQSHIDGSRHAVSPERSIEIQCLLGADIQMQFDECVAYPAEERDAERAMQLSLRWAERSRAAFETHGGAHQALFGIQQGSTYRDQRAASSDGLRGLDFPGYAIGGLAVGEGHQVMVDVLDYAAGMLPEDKPRYLMGVGTPRDLVEAVARGVDMFDCVMPTRSGRHGQVFTWEGKLNLKNARFAQERAPLDPRTPCPASTNYQRAYLHHLVRCNEYLGAMLLSWHNIAFYQDLMRAMRVAIADGTFDTLRSQIAAAYPVAATSA